MDWKVILPAVLGGIAFTGIMNLLVAVFYFTSKYNKLKMGFRHTTMRKATDNFDEALQQVRKHCEIAALTRSEKGSVVVNREELHVIDPVKGVKVVDTTGAGDAYAAGFLYGYTQGHGLAMCGRLGSMMAAEVISHYGPRVSSDVKTLASKVL